MQSNSIPLPRRTKDLTGRVFGRLTVARYAGQDSYGKSRWACLCSCGRTREVAARSLLSGATRSCGCLHAESVKVNAKKHGQSRTPEYAAWKDMWARCTAPSRLSEKPEYAKRVPPKAWRDFQSFLADVGPMPKQGLTLDRIDNDKPYGPGNCRWATMPQQTRNRSTNVWVRVGESVMVMKDACSALNLPYTTVKNRFNKGESVKQASGGLFEAI